MKKSTDFDACVTASVNRTGEVLLSHARLRDRFVIRVAFGNLRTTDAELGRVWELLRREAARIGAERPAPTAG